MLAKMDNNEYLLTTVDNPFDPFEQFDQWLNFDTSKGYNTCGYLNRIVRTSPDLSDYDQDLAIVNAMNEIVRENVYGVHKIVMKRKS